MDISESKSWNYWISAHKESNTSTKVTKHSVVNIFQPWRFTRISLAMEGSHLSPLILFSSAILSSSLLAAAFAAASLASSLANAFWHASLAVAIISSALTAADWICLLNCQVWFKIILKIRLWTNNYQQRIYNVIELTFFDFSSISFPGRILGFFLGCWNSSGSTQIIFSLYV